VSTRAERKARKRKVVSRVLTGGAALSLMSQKGTVRQKGTGHFCLIPEDAAQMSQMGTGHFCLIAPLAGTPVACQDLGAATARAHAAGRLLLADLADCPSACPAIRLGADAMVEPLAEDRVLLRVAADALVGKGADGDWLQDMLASGQEPDAQTDGLLAARNQQWRRASDAAQVVASYLRCHPRVGEVRYPGLRDDPSFDLAARTLEGGFGACVSFRLAGEGDPSHAAWGDLPGAKIASNGGPWLNLTCAAGDPMAQVLSLEGELAKVQ